jgi:ABC-type amino acid transport substrate-binding protein
MKNLGFFFMVTASLFTICMSASAEIIKMGYFELPPHSYTDKNNEKPKGAFILYFEKVASLMGHETEWVGPLPLPRLTHYLKKGNIDGTVGFPKYPKFEELLYYPDKYIFQGQPTLIVRKENPLKQIFSADNLKGYRIGCVKSSSGKYTPLIDDNPDSIKLEELGGERWVEQNLKKLIAGRLDALFDRQKHTIPFVAKTLNLDAQIKVLTIPDPPTPFYIVFSKSSANGKKFLEQCNTIIWQLNLNYEDLLQN